MKMNSPVPVKLLLILLFFPLLLLAQGGTCDFIEPFCAGEDSLIFANCNAADPACEANAEVGPNYGCLSSQPYPAWFYLQIDQAGTLNFQITQNTAFDINGNPTGTGLDVDFIAWGPFNVGDDLCDYSQLQPFNEIGCSYSIQPVENFTITNGMPGEVYVLVITNFNESAGFIKLEQTNAGGTGSGTTDCSILTTQTGCEGDVFTLDATILNAVNYLWEYDDGTGFVTIFNGNFPTINVTNAGDYRATVSFAVGTDQLREFQIITYPNPVIASPPLDQFICDNGTTPGIFDLTTNTPIVLGAQDPLEFEVTYHNSQSDADSGLAPIGTPGAYTITGGLETIYIRIQDTSGTCFITANFDIVYAQATAGPMTNYQLCDVGSNGSESIDLITLKNAEALNGQNPADYSVTYHGTQAEADFDLNPLPNPYIVTAPTETIYVRVESNDSPTCFATDSFVIDILPNPIANQPNDLFICDDGTTPGVFDLTVNTPIVLGAQDPTLFTITYHNSQVDADAGSNPILTPTVYLITGTQETIYIRIEDLSGTCFDTAFFEIEFLGAVAGAVPSPYSVCDLDASGDEVVNLSALFDILVLNGASPFNFSVSYHLSQVDADAGTNALISPYTITTSPLNVFVRLQNIQNPGCFDSSQSFGIVMDVPPTVNTPQPLVICDGNNDGFAAFTLHDADDDITGADPTLIVTYHPTLSDAQNDLNELLDPYTNDDPFNDVVFARIESTTSSCYSTVILSLEVRNTPEIITPAAPLRACDYDNPGDGLEFFDLSSVATEVLDGLDPLLYDIYYYEQEADAITAGDLALTAPDFSQAIGTPTNYQNVTPFLQVVYILVVGNAAYTDPNNGGTGCYAIVP
ncbi:hypothetical protein BXY75_2898, partial [Ulvibacter antarcticus]